MEVGEGSRLVALIGMVEHIRLAKSVKENITYRNLDHLFAMDMDKLKSLVHIGSYNQNSCYVVIDVKFYWWDSFYLSRVSYQNDWWWGFLKKR